MISCHSWNPDISSLGLGVNELACGDCSETAPNLVWGRQQVNGGSRPGVVACERTSDKRRMFWKSVQMQN